MIYRTKKGNVSRIVERLFSIKYYKNKSRIGHIILNILKVIVIPIGIVIATWMYNNNLLKIEKMKLVLDVSAKLNSNNPIEGATVLDFIDLLDLDEEKHIELNRLYLNNLISYLFKDRDSTFAKNYFLLGSAIGKIKKIYNLSYPGKDFFSDIYFKLVGSDDINKLVNVDVEYHHKNDPLYPFNKNDESQNFGLRFKLKNNIYSDSIQFRLNFKIFGPAESVRIKYDNNVSLSPVGNGINYLDKRYVVFNSIEFYDLRFKMPNDDFVPLNFQGEIQLVIDELSIFYDLSFDDGNIIVNYKGFHFVSIQNYQTYQIEAFFKKHDVVEVKEDSLH